MTTETPLMRAHTRRKEIRSMLLRPLRAKRSTPRPDITNMEVFEDPSPDWAWKLVDAILDHVGDESDGGVGLGASALAWCQEGDAPARSTQLQALIGLWFGARGVMLKSFLHTARVLGAGRRRPAKEPPKGLIDIGKISRRHLERAFEERLEEIAGLRLEVRSLSAGRPKPTEADLARLGLQSGIEAAKHASAPARMAPRALPKITKVGRAILDSMGFMRSVIRCGEQLNAKDDLQIDTARDALIEILDRVHAAIDQGKLTERGDFGTVIEVPLPAMARLARSVGWTHEGPLAVDPVDEAARALLLDYQANPSQYPKEGSALIAQLAAALRR